LSGAGAILMGERGADFCAGTILMAAGMKNLPQMKCSTVTHRHFARCSRPTGWK
jgi:hypothetical protein